jgi:hypothetical protein
MALLDALALVLALSGCGSSPNHPHRRHRHHG